MRGSGRDSVELRSWLGDGAETRRGPGRRPGRGRRVRVALAGFAAAAAWAALLSPVGAGAAASPASSGQGHGDRHAAAPAWSGFAGNAQHTAIAPSAPQPLRRVRWQTTVDEAPVVTNGTLLIHYGSPMITRKNTVIVPTRVAGDGFDLRAYRGSDGHAAWSLASDYQIPNAISGQWTPPLPATLTSTNRVAVACAGGTVLIRPNADDPHGRVRRVAFYGLRRWENNPGLYDRAVQISTPITAGRDGSLYFGFHVSDSTATGLSNGIARIDSQGHGTWISATAAGADPNIFSVVLNAAPALSPDGSTVYVPVTGLFSVLVGLDSRTLQPRYRSAPLVDPGSGNRAFIFQNSSASPTIGPDGDVYYGVFETPFPSHNDRGWLLHFDATLSQDKVPGSFGWDNTVSVLPATRLPGYHGSSRYLLVSKYNNYDGLGTGDGQNRIAVLDPNSAQPDPFVASGSVQTMRPVQTVLAPTVQPDASTPDARYEWCINSAVVDPRSLSVMANSEDGRLYRWDLRSNRLAESITLNPPQSEAYTMTVIGPDGTTYAINNATLYAVGR